MPIYNEKRTLPFTPQQMFNLVSDVDAYADFLPWVKKSHTHNISDPMHFDADLVIGTSFITCAYTSNVTLIKDPFYQVFSTCVRGPFQKLINQWMFYPNGHGTDIIFHLDYELNNALLRHTLSPFLDKIVSIMIGAFQERAVKIYP
jgi:coenzyme Q-binding protein COQ10